MAEYEITGTKQITELPEATSYTDGMYYAVASANGGTEKVSITKPTPDGADIRVKMGSLADAVDCGTYPISRNILKANDLVGVNINDVKVVKDGTWVVPIPNGIAKKILSGTTYRFDVWLNNGTVVQPTAGNTPIRIYASDDSTLIQRIYNGTNTTITSDIDITCKCYMQIAVQDWFTADIVGLDFYDVTTDTTILSNYEPYQEGYIKYVTIGQGGDFETIKDGFEFAVANDLGCVIKSGTYDLVAEGIANTTKGYILPKEVIGYGATLLCRLPSENWSISALNINDACSETKVYGLTVICENCRYCIHDEMGESTLSYYHNVFKDLTLIHESATSAVLIAPQSIGGGMGNGGFVEIENCVCKCVYNKDIAYHSYAHKVNGSYVPQTVDGIIIIKDSYIKGRPAASSISDYTSAMNTMYISNCNVGENIQHAAATNMTIIDWNNYKRP